MSSPNPKPSAPPPSGVCAICGGRIAYVLGAQCPRCLLNLGSTLGGLDDSAALNGALLDPFQVRTFGDYELREEIARGGMGVVYRARQISLGREVAVKMILAGELAGKESLLLFRREAQAAANLHHPNIVPVFEIGEHETQSYFTMRFVPGGKTIADWAATRRGNHRALASAAAQAARAVAYAHAHGVLHRDLKPSNILWDADTGPQVTDFGLAKLMDAPTSTITVGARALGSPSYMAPEQTGGNLTQITTATDVYGLGAVLYEMLAGRPPFAGPTIIETMRRAVESEPEPLPDVPRELRTVCFKCLAKRPEDRYASAEALAEDLDRYARGEPVSAVPITAAQRVWRWAQRHPLVASLALLSVTSLVAGVGGIAWQWRQAEVARHGESLALQKATATVLDLYTHGAARETDFTRAALWFAQAAVASPNAVQRAENLARHAVWQRESHTAVRAFASGIGPVQQLAWNPAQTALLGRTTNRAAIWIVKDESRWLPPEVELVALRQVAPRSSGATNLRETSIRQELRPERPLNAGELSQRDNSYLAGGEIENAAWAHRSPWLVVAANGVVRLLDFPSGRELARTNYPGQAPRLAVSRDDRWVLVAGRKSFLWDTENGLVRELPSTPAPPRVVEFSRNGQFVMLCFESTVGVCAVDAPEDFLFPPVMCRAPTVPGFLRDDAFYTCLVNDQIAVLNARTGEQLENYANTTGLECTARFASPDGRRIVTAFAPMLERTKGFLTFPLHPNIVAAGEFSRDGSWLITASYDSVLRRWPLANREPSQQIGWHQEAVLAAAISPDQRFVAAAQGGAELVKVWRLATPPAGREINLGGDSSVRLSADGQLLLPNGSTHENFHLKRTRVFSVETARPVGGEIVAGGDIQDADFAPDGDWLALICSTMPGRANDLFAINPSTGNLQLWNWRTSQRLAEPIPMPSEPRGVAVHPSGRFIAIYAGSGELLELEVATRELRVLRPATRIHSAPYLNHNGRCRYSPDGRWLIGWGMRDEPVLYDRETQKIVPAPFEPGAMLNDVDFRGNVLASVSGQAQIEFLGLPGPARAARTLRAIDRLHLGRFSADGNYFLTGGRGQVAHVWDWRSGRLNAPALRHEGEIYAGVFVPGTECVVTGGLDKKIRFWDRRTGLPMRPPIATSHRILDLAVTPDGRTLIRGSFNGDPLKLYDMADLLPKSSLSSEDALRLAEIDAAAEIINGGVEPLNAPAWFAKWKQFRARHPEWHRW